MANNAERQAKLLLYLQENSPVKREDIFRDLHEYSIDDGLDKVAYENAIEAMRKKLIRDKKELEKLGFFINYDTYKEEYTVDKAASYTVPINLSDAQATMLRYACCSLLDDPSYIFKEDLRMALIKISNEVDAPDMLPFFSKSKAAPSKSSKSSKSSKGAKSDFSSIYHAISQRKIITFEYVDAKGNSSTRTVEPLGVYALDKHFYLVAYDTNRQDKRHFRFDRISNVSQSKNDITHTFEVENFDIEEHILLPFQIGSENFEASIVINANNAWRAERVANRHGKLEKQHDGSYIWTIQANNTEALASWCIASGSAFVPKSPEKLCKAYKQYLLNFIKLNGEK